MKKASLPFFLLSFLLTTLSCSNDDNDIIDSTDDDNLITQSKTINFIEEKIYYNGQIDSQSSASFNYENNQLISLIDGNFKVEFLYNGEKIIESKLFINNVYELSNFFMYEGNLLKSVTQEGEQTLFTYQGDVLASKVNKYEDNGNWITFRSENYQFSNGNITQQITNQFSNTTPYKTTYQYDDKNSIFKGMNPYLKYFIEFETIDPISKNNKLKTFAYENVNSSQGVQSHEYVIIYDVDNYPTSVKKYRFDGVQQELISELTVIYN